MILSHKLRQQGLGIVYPFNKQTSSYAKRPSRASQSTPLRGSRPHGKVGGPGGPQVESGHGSLAATGHTAPLTSVHCVTRRRMRRGGLHGEPEGPAWRGAGPPDAAVTVSQWAKQQPDLNILPLSCFCVQTVCGEEPFTL